MEMNQKIELSIIVPIYNVKDYLEECMDSLLKITNISKQIICIEDVSTDGTNELLKKKYGSMPYVEILTNKKNSGLAYSRNVGLEQSIGEYIMFVDSDDVINSDVIEKFLIKMKNENLDILYFDVKEIFDDDIIENIVNRRLRTGEYKLDTGTAVFDRMVKNGEMFGCVWDGIYRNEFLKLNDLKFLKGTLHEDIPFTFKAILNANRVNVIKEVGYFYRQRKNSILHQSNYLKRTQGLILDYYLMMLTWQALLDRRDICNIEISIQKYVDSVLSLLESNLDKIDSGMGSYDPIIKSFLLNFNFNKYREFNYIKKSSFFEKLKSSQTIGFYGAGKIADKLLPFFRDEGVIISNVLVTEKNNNREYVCGIPVVEFTCEIMDEYDIIIIGVGGNVRDEIEEYLYESGFSGSIIKLPQI